MMPSRGSNGRTHTLHTGHVPSFGGFMWVGVTTAQDPRGMESTETSQRCLRDKQQATKSFICRQRRMDPTSEVLSRRIPGPRIPPLRRDPLPTST